MECHDSSVFLIRKLPLSITEALLKSVEWSWDHAWFAILEPLRLVFTSDASISARNIRRRSNVLFIGVFC